MSNPKSLYAVISESEITSAYTARLTEVVRIIK